MDTSADLNPFKNDLYLGMEQANSTIKIRLFRVLRSLDDEENREMLVCLVEEVEEQGTGFSGFDY
jgi:hypothetical protein